MTAIKINEKELTPKPLHEDNAIQGVIGKELSTLENLHGIEETKDALIFLCEVGNAIRKSLEGDGKITMMDTVHFVGALMKLPAFITGITKIPAELADEITDAEKAILTKVINDANILDDKVEAVLLESIDLILHIKNFIYKNFVKV